MAGPDCISHFFAENSPVAQVRADVSVSLAWTGTQVLQFVGRLAPIVGIGGGYSLAGDIGPFFGIIAVHFQPLLNPGLGVGNDGFHRTFRFTDAAIDAFVGMDDEKVLSFVKAIHGAHFYTIHEFALDASLGNDVGHGFLR
jgi:hypothetical protein